MRSERWLAVGALGLFLMSLALPAIKSDSFPTQRGIELLKEGAGLWRDGVYAWYANPVFIGSLLATVLGWFRSGLAAAVTGLLLALSTFTAPAVLESAGRSVPEFGFASGVYVWLAAILVAILAASAGLAGKSGGSAE